MVVEEKETKSLTAYLSEVVEWRYSYFLSVESDTSMHTSDEGVVLALVRAIIRRKLPAIKEALDRLDGRQAAVTEVVFPTFKMLYPRAKGREHATAQQIESDQKALAKAEEVKEPDEEGLATGSIRDAVIKMGKSPRALVSMILAAQEELEQLKDAGLGNESKHGDPMVKSVIAATLHDMAHRGDIKAIFEVLDQIDGKIANKIEIKGDDVEMVSYDEIAPYNAERNADGIYEVVMPNMTHMWQLSLDPNIDNSRRFGDGR